MSDTAPILKSFIDPAYLAACLEREYGLQGVQCQLIKATMRDMYAVRSATKDKRFVAALYPWHPEWEVHIRAEMTVIAHVHASGMATARPVQRTNGDLLVPVALPEGTRYLVLFEYIRGKPLPRQPDAAWTTAYGEAIARLHSVLDGIIDPLVRLEWKRLLLLETPLTLLAAVLDEAAIVDELQRSMATLIGKLEGLAIHAPAFGLIHGDVIPSNAIVGEDDRLYLIDFDLCGYGWRMYDVATFLNEAAFWDMGDAAESAFLTGYERLRPISEAEKAMIPVLGAARNIWALGNAAAHVNTWGSHIYLSERVIAGELHSLRRNMAKIAG